MAYRLKTDESVPESLRRIASSEVQHAITQLNKRTGRDEAIHEARKSIKKIRGLLRLVQPELGEAYQTENQRLGSIGRKLSEIRDAKATVEIFDRLMADHEDQLQKRAFGSIRRALQKSKLEIERRLDVQKVIRSTISALTATAKRVDKWDLQDHGFTVISDGLKERYRRGRQAMAAAIDNPTPENYHEWRKRVKDHWYHVRLLEDLWKESEPSREENLHNLETWLGDDHNLVVLRMQIEANPQQFGPPETVEVFFGLLDERQKKLRQDSLELGAQIYKVKPGHMTKEMGRLWKDRARTASAA